MAKGRFKRVGRTSDAESDLSQGPPDAGRDSGPIMAGPSPVDQITPNAPRIDAQDRSGPCRQLAVLIGTAVQLQRDNNLSPREVAEDIRKPKVAVTALEDYLAFLAQLHMKLKARIAQEEQ